MPPMHAPARNLSNAEYFGRLLTLPGPVLFCRDASVQYRNPTSGAVSQEYAYTGDFMGYGRRMGRFFRGLVLAAGWASS